MANKFLFYAFSALLLLLAPVSFCYANDEHPKAHTYLISYTALGSLINDTVPDLKKIQEPKTDSSAKETVIKEVPKSKKQAVPIAVPATVKIKPIKIIKPTIIKPVIKIN